MLWIVLALNLLVAGTKLAVGAMVGALSLFADGIHSLLDGVSNLVGLVGISLASAPADRDHPYGHRRFEALAALAIGLLVAAGAVEIVHQVADAFLEDRPPLQPTLLAAIIVGGTIVVNLGVSAYEHRGAKRLRSHLLEADAAHTLSDALGALTVLASFGAAALGHPWLDPLAALLVTLFISRTAYRILRENVGTLADGARLDPAEVEEVVASVPGARGAHHVRSRGSADHIHLDLHLLLDPRLPLADAHELAHGVEALLFERFPSLADVVIHVEPDDGHDEASPSQ